MDRLHMKALIAGLLTSTLVSSVHIYHSNLTISARVKPLLQAGQMAVPNETIIEALTSPMPALAAAVFFVLTAGVFITQIAILTCILIQQLVTHGVSRQTDPRISHHRLAAIVYLLLWAVATLILNYNNFSWILTAHTLIIPLVVQYYLGKKSEKQLFLRWNNRRLLLFILTLVVTGSCFLIKADREIFLRTRDYLLLPNLPGQTISQWYYTYSPHAAEALRSTLAQGSSIDNMAVFRNFCFAGLVIGLPLLFFGILFSMVGIILDRILPLKYADCSAALVTMAMAISLLIYLTPVDMGSDRKNIELGLNGTSPRIRIETLRVIVHMGADIFDFLPQKNMDKLVQGNVPERYWLAKTLGTSPDNRSIPILERLANDNSINVQCASLKALSKKGGSRSRGILKDKIKKNPHWYVQQTALGALKRCR